MNRDTCNRRALLGWVSAGGVSLFGGCSGFDVSTSESDTTYKFSTFKELPGNRIWTPRNPTWADHEQSLVDRMIEGETVTTVGYLLTGFDQWGDTAKASPSFVERDDRFYEFNIEGYEENLYERWLLWFDEIEGSPPADATVITGAPTELSKQDRAAVESAIRKGTGDTDGKNLDKAPADVRGFVFFEHDPEESELVPNPPFTHYEETSEGEKTYYEAVTKRVEVPADAFTYSLSQVASSEAELEAYIENEVYDIDLSSSDLTEAERSRLQKALNSGRYEETGEVSKPFEQLLEKLDFPSLDTSERVVLYNGQRFKYDGTRYSGSLSITVPDNPTATSRI